MLLPGLGVGNKSVGVLAATTHCVEMRRPSFRAQSDESGKLQEIRSFSHTNLISTFGYCDKLVEPCPTTLSPGLFSRKTMLGLFSSIPHATLEYHEKLADTGTLFRGRQELHIQQN